MQQDKWWEAAPVVRPGSIAPRGFIYTPPPDPNKARDQAREDTRLRLSMNADARAAASEQRAADKAAKEDAITQTPGDINLTGEPYLATLPKALAAQVKALAEGRRPFPNNASMRSQSMQELVAAASQYDPTLDAANSATRVATRKDFTSGMSAKNITAINTALGHLGSLWKDAQGLHNRSLPAWNALANTMESATGDARVSKFNMSRHAVVDELEKAFRGSGGTQTGIEEWKQSINSSQSPEQLRSAIGKGVELLNSRLQALGAQYNQGLSRSDEPISLLTPHSQAVFGALQEGGSGVLPDEGKRPPPTLGGTGSSNGPQAPGGPPQGLATGSSRTIYDSQTANGMNALIHRGRSYEEAAAYAQQNGYPVPDQSTYAQAVAYAKDHPGYMAAQATRTVPTTAMQRFSASPLAAGIVASGAGATAGLTDVVGRSIAGPAWDANRSILTATNPKADLAGNVAGGFAGLLAGNAVMKAVAPGVMPALSARLGAAAAPVGDAAYGGLYGMNESPDDPLGGAVGGGLAGLVGGQAGRSLTRGMANIVSPQAGRYAQAYDLGVMPTIGQRFGRSGIAGRAINTAEQALQSVPFAGSLVSRSRQAARDQFQVGSFNDALGDIGLRLPHGMGPGTEPQVFTGQAFDNAYDTARSGMQFVPDQPYLTDHQAFTQTLNSGVLSAPQAAQVQQVISNAVGSRLPRQGGGLNGDSYKAASRDISSAIDTWSRNPDTASMADALRDYRTVFDNAARRNSSPDAVNLLDSADRGYAKYVRIEDASRRVGGDAGTFSPKAFDRSVQNNSSGVRSREYLRGNALMQDMADAAKGLDDTLPNSGTADRLLTSRAAVGVGGLATGAEHALLAHPGALAPFALYAPGIDSVVKRAIAPNAQRFSFSPDLAATLDRIGLQINDLAPLVGRGAVPGALGYYGANR